ncbi:GntR family transcriptional regulator [Microbacterium sp. HD4P20]|uniref:GntR family transcriptional regulator n=1 Tax=Microbacterium sp. HD4P20 TaxID=2864874 RepID=UPI001C641AE6|nr:GntR family transcriptional regulator [Microbacterium sp. HD4P20]MCP2636024.1 GntR family transcriptional regulator [Microbacterium sp. HD4P20]
MANDETVWPDELFVDLDRTGPVPLYFQVSSRLESAIRSGRIAPGARLENEIAIGQRLGLSRPTVRRAIQELVDQGLLVRRRGIGTQVVQGQVTRQVELTSLYEDLQTAHHEPSTRVLTHELVPASDAVAEGLGVPKGEEVVFMRRQRSTDGVPVAVLENYLPREFSDITTEQLESRGLYQILRGRGVTIRIAKQKIGARRATGDESELLDIDKSGAVLTMDRIAFDSSGRAVEYGHHCYRPDMYSFETTLVAK